MPDENQRFPAGAFIPLAIRHQAEDASRRSRQSFAKRHSGRQTQTMTQTARGKNNVRDALSGGMAAQTCPLAMKREKIGFGQPSQGPKGDIERAHRMPFG